MGLKRKLNFNLVGLIVLGHISFLAGGGMGIFMGMLFGALENPLHADTMTARQQFVHAARTMSAKSMQMAKTFAVMGAIFAGTECVFEKVDLFNYHAIEALACLLPISFLFLLCFFLDFEFSSVLISSFSNILSLQLNLLCETLPLITSGFFIHSR